MFFCDLVTWYHAIQESGSRSQSGGGRPQVSSSAKPFVKASVDGIPPDAFPVKSCQESYASSYRSRPIVLERSIELNSFSDTIIPSLFSKFHWNSLATFPGSSNATLVKLFYSNIIEQDLDLLFLKSIIFGKELVVTP